MTINLTGSILIEVKSNDEINQIEINSSEFSLEEDDMRKIGDGDCQYEALYIYFGDDFRISFQATRSFNGNVTIYPLKIEGDVAIIEDNLSAEINLYSEDDY